MIRKLSTLLITRAGCPELGIIESRSLYYFLFLLFAFVRLRLNAETSLFGFTAIMIHFNLGASGQVSVILPTI